MDSSIEYKGIRLGNTKFGALAYADDLVLIDENERNPREIAKKVIVSVKRTALEINEEKTEFTVIQREPKPNDQNKYLNIFVVQRFHLFLLEFEKYDTYRLETFNNYY